MKLRLAWPLIALLFVATACKKTPATNEPEMHPVYGEVFVELRGELTDDDTRRDEDNSPVDYHEIELVEGQNVYVRMEAVTPFRTFLMVGTPDWTGGHINNNCMPGEEAASCIRFTADQTGTYTLMANGAREEDRGEYVLWVFNETDEEAAERMETHQREFAIATERRKQARLDEFEAKIQEALSAYGQKQAQREKPDADADPNEEAADTDANDVGTNDAADKPSGDDATKP